MSVGVKNLTGYPTGEVRRLVRRALSDIGADDVDVTVLHRRRAMDGDLSHATGRYFSWWTPRRGETRERIRISLPPPGVEPGCYHPYERKRGDCPTFPLADWREALVAVAAHEGMHHRQVSRNGYRSSRKAKGGRHRYVESECDLAAYRAVRYYREDQVKRKLAA